ncbi:hypothetical protein [Micromonospora sp. MA102]|uniref:hypothetical protein n=1 Tax=Micromonospora sp. MA102 TaxID=2952755 RepID=UPI0029056892|nr:hypothetical protein [Micromonospora sp. MA102]
MLEQTEPGGAPNEQVGVAVEDVRGAGAGDVLDVLHRQRGAGGAQQFVSGPPGGHAQRRMRGGLGQVDAVAQGGEGTGEDLRVQVGGVTGPTGVQLPGVPA